MTPQSLWMLRQCHDWSAFVTHLRVMLKNTAVHTSSNSRGMKIAENKENSQGLGGFCESPPQTYFSNMLLPLQILCKMTNWKDWKGCSQRLGVFTNAPSLPETGEIHRYSGIHERLSVLLSDMLLHKVLREIIKFRGLDGETFRDC